MQLLLLSRPIAQSVKV